MKASRWRKLAREHLLPDLPDCQLTGTMLVFGHPEWILHGLSIDTSAFSATRVAVWIVSQGLYVPSQHNSADYSEKLRQPRSNATWWDMEAGAEIVRLREMLRAIQEQALPFYAETATPQDLAAYSERRYPDSVNPPTIEVEAYSWALAGEGQKASMALDRLERAVAAMPPYQTWGQAILERSLLVRQALSEGPLAVSHLLGGWRDEARQRLKLDRLPRVRP